RGRTDTALTARPRAIRHPKLPRAASATTLQTDRSSPTPAARVTACRHAFRRSRMLADAYPYYLASKPVFANRDLEVTDKYSGSVATHVALADAAAIDAGIAAAVGTQAAMAAFPPYKRQQVLMHCVQRFTQRAEE